MLEAAKTQTLITDVFYWRSQLDAEGVLRAQSWCYAWVNGSGAYLYTPHGQPVELDRSSLHFLTIREL
jgi:hypothetical protein